MEYVLLSLVVLFVGGILGLAILCGVVWHLHKKHQNVRDDLVKFESSLLKELHALTEELQPLKDLIVKAHTDLSTIVNEYEINGVPLGYDRGKKADYVEGL